MVVDVGANVGMASFVAAVMGFRVLAFDDSSPCSRICSGYSTGCTSTGCSTALWCITLRGCSFWSSWDYYDAQGDWSTGQQCYICRRCKVSIKSNAEIAVEVSTIPLDELVPDTERVLLIKVDVQGWEYHVLGGASNLLSRRKGEAPYLIYEEDEHLLQAGNSSAQDIRTFLTSVGYNHCKRHGNGAHGKRNRQICFWLMLLCS